MVNNKKEMIKDFIHIFFNNIEEEDTKLVYLNPDPIKDFFEKYSNKPINEDDLESVPVYFILKYQDILKIYDITVSSTWLPYYKDKHILI
jgi:hypothetical protein